MIERPFSTELAVEAVKGTPAVAMSALTLNEWLIAISIFYVCFQTAYLARKWWKEERAKKDG